MLPEVVPVSRLFTASVSLDMLPIQYSYSKHFPFFVSDVGNYLHLVHDPNTELLTSLLKASHRPQSHIQAHEARTLVFRSGSADQPVCCQATEGAPGVLW